MCVVCMFLAVSRRRVKLLMFQSVGTPSKSRNSLILISSEASLKVTAGEEEIDRCMMSKWSTEREYEIIMGKYSVEARCMPIY